MVTFREQCALWAKIQADGAARRSSAADAQMLADARRRQERAAINEYPELLRKVRWLSPIAAKCELNHEVAKLARAKNTALERKVERRRRARAGAAEVQFGPSMLAHRVWLRTGRSDWAAAIRLAWLEGSDVMDLTVANARAIRGLDDPDAFCVAMHDVRDELTRPVAELMSRLHDRDDDVANWFDAQHLLRALFARGLVDPTEARLCAVRDVVDRFTCDRSIGVVSMANALRAALHT